MENWKNVCFLLTTDHEPVRKYIEDNGGIITSIADTKEFYDVAVFTPGAQPSPFFYGEMRRPEVFVDINRDLTEARLYREIPEKTPKIGIGRGAQFLNIMNGGGAWQKSYGHMVEHMLLDFMSGDTFYVTSNHNDEMIPGPGAAILAGARASDRKLTDKAAYSIDLPDAHKNNKWDDTEVAFYELSNSFCFQPRPDFVFAGGTKAQLAAAEATRELFEGYYDDWVAPKIKV